MFTPLIRHSMLLPRGTSRRSSRNAGSLALLTTIQFALSLLLRILQWLLPRNTPANPVWPSTGSRIKIELPMDTPTFRESVSDAIRFWEPRRLVYNAVLSVIVLFYFFRAYPASKAVLTLDSILGMFLLVVLANVAYCAACLVPRWAETHRAFAASPWLVSYSCFIEAPACVMLPCSKSVLMVIF